MPVTLTYDLGLVMQGVVTAVGSRTHTSSLKSRILRKCPLISSASFPLACSCPFNSMAFITAVLWTRSLPRRFPLLYTLTCLRYLGSKGAIGLVERRDFTCIQCLAFVLEVSKIAIFRFSTGRRTTTLAWRRPFHHFLCLSLFFFFFFF